MRAQILRQFGQATLATFVHVVVAVLVYEYLAYPAQPSNLIGFFSSVFVMCIWRFELLGSPRNYHESLPRCIVLVIFASLAASCFVVWIITSFVTANFVVVMLAVALVLQPIKALAYSFCIYTQRDALLLPSWPIVLVAGISSMVFISVYFNWPINHDTAWYLVATRKMLGGATLYVDIVDASPPLIFYLTLPSLLIADGLAISDTNGQYFAVALLYITSLLWSGAILRREAVLFPVRRVMFVGLLAVAYVLPAIDSISQPEHLFLLFLSPWFIGHLAHGTSKATHPA